MAKIVGIEGMDVGTLRSEIERGGKFVAFPYVISVIILSFSNDSDIYFIRAGESALAKGWPFALLSFFFGWWGFPWGLIRTPIALFQTLGGGKDITAGVMSQMMPAAPPVAYGAPPVVGPPRNPWSSH